jgi:hypothetical protein
MFRDAIKILKEQRMNNEDSKYNFNEIIEDLFKKEETKKEDLLS